MTDMDAIRERHAKASKGPWFVTGMDLVNEEGGEYTQTYIVSGGDDWLCEMIQTDCAADATFVASAWEDIATLLSLVDRLQSQIDAAKAEWTAHVDAFLARGIDRDEV